MMRRGMGVQFDPYILPCFFAALTEMHDLAESIPDEEWQEQHTVPIEELLEEIGCTAGESSC